MFRRLLGDRHCKILVADPANVRTCVRKFGYPTATMKFEPLDLAGAWLVTPEQAADDRGFFARVICVK